MVESPRRSSQAEHGVSSVQRVNDKKPHLLNTTTTRTCGCDGEETPRHSHLQFCTTVADLRLSPGPRGFPTVMGFPWADFHPKIDSAASDKRIPARSE